MLSTSAALSKDRRTGLAPMQHRHFATIAAIIASIDDRAARHHVAWLFAGKLQDTNANFDRTRFLKACGVTTP